MRPWVGRLLAVAALALGVSGGSAAAELAPLEPATAPAFAADPRFEARAEGEIRFQMTLSEPLEHQVFTLSAPNRLVIDFPELSWRMRGGDAERPDGVTNLRYGLFQVGRSRLVFELSSAARILRHAAIPGDADAPARFIIDFTLGASARKATPPTPAPIQADAPTDAAAAAPAIAAAPIRRPNPIIVALDPGHGGRDSGAAHGGLSERKLTLQFARELRKVLHRPGYFHVVLTRDHNEFVALGERVRRARAKGADLFLSIHADAIVGHPEVSGASVYTLSDRASDALAGQLAHRANASDALAGVPMEDQADDIRRILVDLARTRTLEESHRLAQLLVTELGARVPVLKRRPHRQAGFRVLKTFDTPSALIELGFLTNRHDRARLANPKWRAKAAEAVAKAVQRWARGDRSDTVEAAAQYPLRHGGRAPY